MTTETQASHAGVGERVAPFESNQSRNRSVPQLLRDYLDPGEKPTAGARYLQWALLLLIAANVLLVIAETVGSIYGPNRRAFHAFEIFSVAIFTLEYVLRIWSAPAYAGYEHPLWGRVRFAFRPLLLIDLLAVLPFYLSLGAMDLRVLRALRLVRIFRIAKMARYAKALRLLQRVVRSERDELVAGLSLLLLLVLVASSLMYFAEHEAQPKAFSSIPAAMWWGIMTVTTVGYGDVYPVTVLGKVLAALNSSSQYRKCLTPRP